MEFAEKGLTCMQKLRFFAVPDLSRSINEPIAFCIFVNTKIIREMSFWHFWDTVKLLRPRHLEITKKNALLFRHPLTAYQLWYSRGVRAHECSVSRALPTQNFDARGNCALTYAVIRAPHSNCVLLMKVLHRTTLTKGITICYRLHRPEYSLLPPPHSPILKVLDSEVLMVLFYQTECQ